MAITQIAQVIPESKKRAVSIKLTRGAMAGSEGIQALRVGAEASYAATRVHASNPIKPIRISPTKYANAGATGRFFSSSRVIPGVDIEWERHPLAGLVGAPLHQDLIGHL
jgi:hypothetical protein